MDRRFIYPYGSRKALRKLPPVLAALAAVAILGGACAQAATTLHPGDTIAVTVFNHPELSLPTVKLDGLGQASLPLAGLVGANNATPSQLSARIRDRLAPYVRKPAVDVQLVAQGQDIFVSGGPGGVLTYSPGETLSVALSQLRQAQTVAQAGAAGAGAAGVGAMGAVPATQAVSDSLQYSGIDLRRVTIVRDGADLAVIDAQRLNITGSPGPALQPDDTIELVHKPVPVLVEGEVNHPGTTYLYADEPLSDALLQAGGPDTTASAIKFTLTRDGQRTPVSTSSPQYQAPAQLGDVVYVPHDVRIGVVGQVIKPGDVELRGDNSLLSALYYAGGPTKYGDIKHVALIHQGVQSTVDVTNLTHGAPSSNPELSDGDTVFVPEGHKIDWSLLFQGIVSATYLRFL